MAFQPAVNCAEAYISNTCNTKTVGNRLTFEHLGGAYVQADIDALANAVDAWYATNLKVLMPIETEYVNTHVRGLASSLDLEADNNDGAGVGSNGGEPLPNNVTFAIKFSTGLTGRSGRGRMFMCCIPVGALAPNEDMFTSAQGDAYVDALDLLPAAVGAVDWQHVLVSRFSGGVKRAPNALVIPITDYLYVDLGVDTRRKRLG